MRKLAVVVCAAALGVFGAMAAAPSSAHAAAAPATCTAIAAAEPQTGHTQPPAALALFASGFPALTDCEWGYPLGGFGGDANPAHKTLHHTPVIFVHGNQADAENWFLVRDAFRAAGYSDRELYALSYNGLENGSAGMPTCCVPSADSTAYWQNTSPPYDEFCCNGGHGASDEPNVADLYAFVHAVQLYTGSQQVDIVAHSLGVTITREMLRVHPELRADVLAAIMVAGANHGTTVCRGLDTSYYGCDEIAPGTPWLAALNAAGEAPGPTHWMSVYNGADNADPFFQAVPGVFDDTQSPHLNGADANVSCPQTYHNDLRVRPDIVQMDIAFLLRAGQAPGLAAVSPPALVVPASCTLVDAVPAASVPEGPGAVMLLVGAGAGGALVAIGRRRRSGGRVALS